MTALQLIESLAINPDYKRDLLNPTEQQAEWTLRAQQHIAELDGKNGKFWCALVPAKDDEPDEEQDTPDEDDDSETKPAN